MAVRIPKPTSIEKAIRIYYGNIELYSKDIKELFGVGSNTAVNLKRIAKEHMLRNDVPSWNATAVNTKSAFEVWGLNIDDLEKRHKKLKALIE